MEVTPGAQNAGTHKQVPATGGSAMGPQTATVPGTAAQAILHAEELEQQARPDSINTHCMLVHCSCSPPCFVHVHQTKFCTGRLVFLNIC